MDSSAGEPMIAELGDLRSLGERELRRFDVGDDGIVVCRLDGELHALVDRCSHAMAHLSEGRVRGSNIFCPLHGAGFDVRTGCHTGPPAVVGVTCVEITSHDETNVTVRLPSGGNT